MAVVHDHHGTVEMPFGEEVDSTGACSRWRQGLCLAGPLEDVGIELLRAGDVRDGDLEPADLAVGGLEAVLPRIHGNDWGRDAYGRHVAGCD